MHYLKHHMLGGLTTLQQGAIPVTKTCYVTELQILIQNTGNVRHHKELFKIPTRGWRCQS